MAVLTLLVLEEEERQASAHRPAAEATLRFSHAGMSVLLRRCQAQHAKTRERALCSGVGAAAGCAVASGGRATASDTLTEAAGRPLGGNAVGSGI